MHNQPPQVESFRDLCYLSEVFSTEDDGSHKFSRSTFAIITHDYHVWIGQAPIRKKDLSPKSITESLKLVPDEDVYPEPPSHITTASVPIDGNVFVKGPKVGGYNAFAGIGSLSKLLLQEAETLEILRCNQHPNIIRCHGSIIRRGRIVGLVLDRHPRTLELEARLKARKINSDLCFDGIKAAVEHLHSLGLAHNDLTPYNIMIGEDGTPVVIDYGSCQPFGKNLITAGTPGWVDEDFTTSAQRNDEIALGKLQAWLKEQTR
jgi:serine/threonine protein kinase